MTVEGAPLRGVAEVVEWHAEDGWGEVVVSDTGDQVWVPASAVDMPGRRYLEVGRTVEIDYAPGDHDGYHFRALRAVPLEG